MQGTIQEVEQSSSGKSVRVNVGGQWYSCKNFGIQSLVGQEITFEPTTNEWKGKTYHWINDYSVTDQSPISVPRGPSSVAVANKDCMPMTSNLVAHAIAAGKIETPDQILSWANAAFDAAHHCLTKTVSTSEEFDDEIPF